MGNPGVPVAVYSYEILLYNNAIWENQWLVQMENTINVSNNVDLILNTYRRFFLQTATENLQCCWTASFASVEMERFWNLQQSQEFVNHNGTKIVMKSATVYLMLCAFI